ncbi:MAG TPA: hydroxyisourate hydrolase [Acidimicrobiia bacterium]|nr:hydroxyisourate hydrolase [Acidimicrobiia bacterium]
MTTLSTHVLDTATGEPAAGMRVTLSRATDRGWDRLGEHITDEDGRVSVFGELSPGRHRLGFETGEYGNDFYPFVAVVFEVEEGRPHYHVPLLLSPFGYSTYRGS